MTSPACKNGDKQKKKNENDILINELYLWNIIDGSNPGYQSIVAFFPYDDLVIALLTNVDNTDLPNSLPYYIADGMLGLPKSIDWLSVTVEKTKELYAKGGDDLPDRIKNKPPSHKLIEYAGEYTHPIYGTIVITLKKDGKALHMKLRTLEIQLEHYHYESFNGPVHEFGLKGNVFLTFVTGAKGDVEAVEALLPDESDPLSFGKAEEEEEDK